MGRGSGDHACPCGTGRRLRECCGPIVSGERLASTAQELMRSRYTAFAVGDADHLWRSWHPRTRPSEVRLEPETRWVGLRVVDAVGGLRGDATGTVEFVASYEGPDGRGRLHEVSRFEWRARRWLYVDGDHELPRH